ncbi:MAG: response regulator [Candidatus Sericytochromatia bacterium]|nr:response regulator [Candidatus Sericytochromatia bacterium]
MLDAIKYTILLVEDDLSILKLLDHIFKKDYNTFTAENGRIALEKIKENKFDLIISDIMMPDIDGFEFKQQLNLDHINKDIPFIFLSAMSDFNTRSTALKLGVTEYIVKPVKPIEIKEKIKQFLQLQYNEKTDNTKIY